MKYSLTKLGRSDKLLAATEAELNTVSVKESNSRFHIIQARAVYLPLPEHLSSQLLVPITVWLPEQRASSSAALSSVTQSCNLSQPTGEDCGDANLSYS